jgi:hypothetical protein
MPKQVWILGWTKLRPARRDYCCIPAGRVDGISPQGSWLIAASWNIPLCLP